MTVDTYTSSIDPMDRLYRVYLAILELVEVCGMCRRMYHTLFFLGGNGISPCSHRKYESIMKPCWILPC